MRSVREHYTSPPTFFLKKDQPLFVQIYYIFAIVYNLLFIIKVVMYGENVAIYSK